VWVVIWVGGMWVSECAQEGTNRGFAAEDMGHQAEGRGKFCQGSQL
jgi:hypothetical protein